jgi:hypothetical protein
MKRILFYLAALFLCGCTRVADLSDDVSLSGFNILSHEPADIQLGTPVIRNDTVYVPVLRGVALFPLTLSVEPQFATNTKQAVTGSSFLSFDNIKFELDDIDTKTFYLIAESGLPKPYYIVLDIEGQKKRSDFLSFEASDGQNGSVAAHGYINPVRHRIDLYVMKESFPLSLNISATISEEAVLKNSEKNVLDENDFTLNFDGMNSKSQLYVEAENGQLNEWSVCLKGVKQVTGNESGEILSAVSLPENKAQHAVAVTQGFSVKDVYVDRERAEVRFSVVAGGSITGVEIIPELQLPANSQTTGYRQGESVVFADEQSTVEFGILDNRSGYIKNWKFSVVRGDITDLYEFPFTWKDASASGNFIQFAEEPHIDNNTNTVTLTITRYSQSSGYWPVTVTPRSLEMSAGAVTDITYMDFAGINEVKNFTVRSGDTEETWSVRLVNFGNLGKDAEILSFRIIESSDPLLSDSRVVISGTAPEVLLNIPESAFPLHILPEITVSRKAVLDNYQNGSFLEFESYSDFYTITVTAENGTEKDWKIRLVNKKQLDNSDFELWSKVSTNMLAESIDPIPGIGRGWATANNLMVKGTVAVNHSPYGKAAELSTSVITSYPKNLITAATLFLGRFDMEGLPLETPKKMTKFGIPFDMVPVAIEIDAKYSPGPVYQRSKHISGSGISGEYVLETVAGQDKGHIWAELIHWSGDSQLDYSGDPQNGLYVLARAEYVFTGESDWKRIHIPLTRLRSDYAPTHLLVVMTSSIEGDRFIGAVGSKLTVDNFELKYE